MKKGQKKWLSVALLAVVAIAPVVAPRPVADIVRAVAELLGAELLEPEPVEDRSSDSLSKPPLPPE